MAGRALIVLALLCVGLTACTSNGTGSVPPGTPLCGGATEVTADGATVVLDSIGTPGCRGTVVLPDQVCPYSPTSLNLVWDRESLWSTSLLPSESGGSPPAVTGSILFTVPSSARPGTTGALRLICWLSSIYEGRTDLPAGIEARVYQVQFTVTAPSMPERVSAKPGKQLTLQVHGLSCATTQSADQTVVVEWNGATSLGEVAIKEPYAPFNIVAKVPDDAARNTDADLTVRCKKAAKPAVGTKVAVGQIVTSLKPDVTPVTPGRKFSVTGIGLDCSDYSTRRVSIYFGESDGAPRVGGTESDVLSTDQAFTASVTVPLTAAPDTTYALTARCGGGSAAITSTIKTERPTATLAIAPNSGAPGARVNLTAKGMYCAPDADGKARIVARWDADKTVLGSLPDASSAFSTYKLAITVPTVTPGTHVVSVSCGTVHTGFGGPAPVDFQVIQTVIETSPAAISALAGQHKRLHLVGGNCIEKLTVSWDDSSTVMSLPWSAPAGADLTVTIPPDRASPGLHALTFACTEQTDKKAQVNVFVPGLTAGPTSGAAGGTVTLTGSGFLCPDGKANVAWDKGKSVAATVAEDGTFTLQVRAPAQAGRHELTATCKGSEAANAPEFTVKAGAVAANPARAAVGQHVTLHATFVPSDCTDIGVTLGPTKLATTTVANDDHAGDGRTVDMEVTVPDGTGTGSTTLTLTCGGPVPAAYATGFEVLAEPVPSDNWVDLTGVLATVLVLLLVTAAGYAIRRFRGPPPPGLRITIRPGRARITIGRQP